MSRGEGPTDSELISELRELADNIRGVPTTADVYEKTPYSPRAYKDRFGSWRAVLEAAEVDRESLMLRDLSRLKNDSSTGIPLRLAIERDGWFSIDEYRELGDSLEEASKRAAESSHESKLSELVPDPSTTEYEWKTFEYGKNTTENSSEPADPTADGETHEPAPSTREELLDTLQKIERTEGRLPKTTDLRGDESVPSTAAFSREFGTWDDALTAAGFDVESRLLDEFQKVATAIGKIPTERAVSERAEYSPGMYKRIFGSWDDVVTRHEEQYGPPQAGDDGRPEQEQGDTPAEREPPKTSERRAESEGSKPDGTVDAGDSGDSADSGSGLAGTGESEQDPEKEIDAILDDVLSETDSVEPRTPASKQQSSGSEWRRPGDPARKEAMLESLQEVAETLGETPSVRQFKALSQKYSPRSISEEFGGWNAAKKAAGLETKRRGKATSVNIDETYFESIDTTTKAYWLAALIGRSSLNINNEYSRMLAIVRTKSHAHFVEEFADAVDSEYSISQTETTPNEQNRLQLSISNPTFIDNLVSAGYPGEGEEVAVFPDLDSPLREAFLRGYLESCGYFTAGGWQIKVHSQEQADRLEEWIEGFGVKRVTVSSKTNNASYVVRVSNVFDVRAMFEACWPDLTDTEPCYEPYPQKILDYLREEYPYPENLDYLS